MYVQHVSSKLLEVLQIICFDLFLCSETSGIAGSCISSLITTLHLFFGLPVTHTPFCLHFDLLHLSSTISVAFYNQLFHLGISAVLPPIWTYVFCLYWKQFVCVVIALIYPAEQDNVIWIGNTSRTSVFWWLEWKAHRTHRSYGYITLCASQNTSANDYADVVPTTILSVSVHHVIYLWW